MIHKRILKFTALMLGALLIAGLLGACSTPAIPSLVSPASSPSADGSPSPTVSPVASPSPSTDPTPDPSAEAALAAARQLAVDEAEQLRLQYDYDAALDVLSPPDIAGGIVDEKIAEIEAEVASLVPFTDDIPHIFFHSLIVYPEMVFTDLSTPLGGYNAGFSEKAELEKILPQLYERGYVLYNLEDCWEMVDGNMVRNEILLPPGKTPLILSIDDVAYAYGGGYAQKLFVDDDGALVYLVRNPSGETEEMPDGDVMGVVSLFVEEHPDFSYQGHKGTLAMTGFQGAFGYSFETADGLAAIQEVAEVLKADGWNFASHSYTHNRNNFYGPNSNPANIEYDINKWIATDVPAFGETRLFIAPFGYRVKQPGLQYILDAGFDIYCTVGAEVYNELNDDYALMTRIEIGGYSMTYFTDILNERFFNVDEVFDNAGRPPVIG